MHELYTYALLVYACAVYGAGAVARWVSAHRITTGLVLLVAAALIYAVDRADRRTSDASTAHRP